MELHAYAATGPRARVESELLARLRAVYPETTRARIVADRVEWRADCPLFAPGTFRHRPGVLTPVDGLVLAGDCVRVDLPVALMERAATTGWQAANQLLARWGVAGHDLLSVPTSGRHTVLRGLAALLR